MSDIDVKATLTADDQASPVIRALLRQVKRLEKANFCISADKMKASLTGAASAAGALTAAQARNTAALRTGLRVERDRATTSLKVGADLRKRLSFEARMQRQKASEERKAARTAAAVLRVETANKMRAARQDIAAKVRADALQFRALRQKLDFQSRMTRQRASEAQEIERQDRLRENAHRWEVGRIDRENRARRRAFANTGRTTTGALRDASHGSGTAAMLTGGAAADGGFAIGRREASTDAAEKDLMTWSGYSASAARKVRDGWATRSGIDLGRSAADMLVSLNNALKAGVPTADAEAYTELLVQAADVLGIRQDVLEEVFAKQKALLTSEGSRYRQADMRSWINALTSLSKMSVTPEELATFNLMGAGGGKLLNMTPEGALAFGATSISLGNRPGESGTLLDYLGGTVIGLRRNVRREGEEGDRARRLVKAMGYGSVDQLDRDRRADPDGFLPNVFDRIHKLPAQQRDQATRDLFQQEWLGEGSRLISGGGTYREAIQLQREAKRTDALSAATAIHWTKIEVRLRKMLSAFGSVMDEFGKTLGPMVGATADRLREWFSGNSKQLGTAFWAGTQGLITGIMGRDANFNDLLNAAFGKGGLGSNPSGVYEFMKGFGEGLRSVAEGISWIATAAKSFIEAVAGSDPQKVGKLAAQTLSFGLAAKAAAPGMAVARDAAIAGVGGAFTIGKLMSWFRGGTAVAGTAAGVAAGGALAVSVAAVAAGLTLAVTIANWGELREWFTSLFGRPGWTERREENDARRARGDNPDPVDSVLNRWFGGAFGRRSDAVTGGGGQGEARGYPGRDRLTGSDLAPATMPLGGASGGKLLLDAIARAEGTAGRGDYETVLGYGKYGKPNKPITQMSLAEAFAFGREIKSRHGSSSAIGRYQIVGNTMKDAAGALGMDWNTTKFDATTQDKMAEWIRQKQGFGAWEGFRRNPAELATARAAVAGAPTISTAGTALAVNNVRYANTNATRNKRVTDSLQASLSEAVMNAYGPGYTAEIYSGGQDRKGHGHRRTGSTRHDDGRAADVYVYDPRGKRLSGDMLGPIAQEWLARQRGGVGLEMRGGGIHLDEHKDRAKTWTYGAITPGQRQAVAAGLAGQVPPSAARQAPADLAARVPLPSARPGGAGGGGMGGGGGVSIGGITVNGANRDPREIAQEVGREFQRMAGWTTGDIAFDA